MDDSASHWISLRRSLPACNVKLGPAIGNAYLNDPKMLGFVLSRYKFAAKMLSGKKRVVEVGCGDGFGAPLISVEVGELVCTDIDEEQLRDNAKRSVHPAIDFVLHDFRNDVLDKFDAAYAIDVLEHVYPSEQIGWMSNIVWSLTPHGVLLIGTPNATSQCYASEHSREGHVNCKTFDELRRLGSAYFRNVFMFGQSDEVVHTGFGPMCQYLWMLGVGPRR